MSEFTIVVQGPYNEIGIAAAENYVKYGSVIFSPSTTDVAKYQGCFNSGNILYQCLSTLKGLSSVTTKFAIKVRFDEKYEKLDKLIDKVLNNPTKIVTNNIGFCRAHIAPFHISDHVLAGQTDNLKLMYQATHDLCISLKSTYGNLDSRELGLNYGHFTTESVLGSVYLINKGLNIANLNIDQIRIIMKEHFDVVPVKDFGEVLHTIFADGRRNFRKNSEGLYGYPHDSIDSMEQL